MPFPGLPQGFVRFGTVAHSILLALRFGDATMAELVEECGLSAAEVSRTLLRLKHGRFVHRHTKVSKYDTGLQRSQYLYSLKRRAAVPYAPAAGSVRQARHTAARSMRVSSVFEIGRRM